MRGQNAFIATVLLVSTALLILFGISALSPLTPKKKAVAGKDELVLTPLDKPTVQFGNPQRGAPDAAVTIVEFGDYQCGPCSQVETALAAAIAEYPTAVRVVWKDMPNESLHPESMDAAIAARCAAEQGAFWEFHDLLLANQVSLNETAYEPIATEAGIDVDTFKSCYAAKNLKPIVQRDIEEGVRLRVDSTPFLFVNGRRVSGAISYDQLKTFIDAALSGAEAPAQK